LTVGRHGWGEWLKGQPRSERRWRAGGALFQFRRE
jgi:hypothetical protein